MTAAAMYDHMVNALKGWPAPHALDKSADLADGESVEKGEVMCLDANANFVKGLTCGAVGVISLRDSSDSDVRQSYDETNAYGMTGGVVSGLVTTGPFEVESTEFVADDYAPNDPLTAVAAGATRGQITKGVSYTDTLIGVVSDGLRTGKYSKQVIRFWTVWLPPLTCPSSSSA
jgi:hypothetical protein